MTEAQTTPTLTAATEGAAVGRRVRIRTWRTLLLTRLEDLTEWPLIVLAAALVPLLAGRFLFDLSPTSDQILLELTSLIWAVYAVDLLLKLAIAPHRLAFLRARATWLDELMVLLPLFHPLADDTSLDNLFHAARLAVAVLRVIVGIQRVAARPGLPYSLLAVMLVVLTAGTLAPVVERDAPEATILTLSDGVWWSIETITTAGYGDYYPTTELGKGLAVVLMVLGVTLYGVLAGNLAVLFARQADADAAAGAANHSESPPDLAQREEPLIAKLEAIEERLIRMEEQLRRRPENGDTPPSPPAL
jgi:voltage-gated potassium channel